MVIFLHTPWQLLRLILDVHTLLHFVQMKIWAEDDRDAARSVCLQCCSFAALCLCLELTTGFSH